MRLTEFAMVGETVAPSTNAVNNLSMLLTRAAIAIVAVVITAYLAACVFLLTQQRRLMFFPSSTLVTNPEQAYNLRYEEVWIPVQTEKVHAWWIPAAQPERGVVLHFHGNGSNISGNLSQAVRFHQLGYSVLMVDYRGYGRSTGEFPSEASVYQDAEASWAYLTQQRRISPDRIVLFGHSLGGAVAIYLAQQQPQAAGLIVQSSFTSMRAMVDAVGQYRIFPVDWLLNQKFASLDRVSSLQMPVLYIHGTQDALLPHQMSEALYAATPEPKRLHLVENAEHNDVAEVGGAAYLQVLRQFFDQAIPSRS